MIRRLTALLGRAQSRDLRRAVLYLSTAAASQGGVFAVLLPILRGPRWPWLLAATAATAVCGLCYYRGVAAGRRAGYTLSTALHQRLGDHVGTLPLGWFTPARVGSFGRIATQNVMSVMGVPAHLLDPLISAVITPAATVVVLSIVDLRLGMAAAATLPCAAAACWWTIRLVRATEHGSDAAAAEAAGRVVEFAQNQPVLRAFGREAHGLRLLDDALAAQHRAGRRMLRTAVPGLAGFVVAVQTAFTVVLLLGVFSLAGGRIDAVTLVVALVLAVRFTEPMLTAAELGAALRMAGNSLERVQRVLAEPRLPEPERSPPLGQPSIEFAGVRFGYDGHQVLDSIDLRVPERTTTALVGPSGAGKTTVLRLVARFFDVEGGAVRVGGADVRELRTEDLLGRISLVSQDVYLFAGAVADTIRSGRPGASDAEVQDAARRAGAADLLTRNVGEGGAGLSGGERQRVSIARALLKNAPILLLDEPTAALDAASEKTVAHALAELRTDTTVLVITHRLSTVRAADQIVVLDGGRIIERGPHASLLAQGGRYAEFHALRSSARGWRIATREPTRGK